MIHPVLKTTHLPLNAIETDLLILPYGPQDRGGQEGGSVQALDAAIARAKQDLSGACEKVTIVYPESLPAGRICLVGTGEPESYSRDRWARLGAIAAQQAAACDARHAAIVLPQHLGEDAETALGFTEGVLLGCYRFDRYKTRNGEDTTHLEELQVVADSKEREEAISALVKTAGITASATGLARDLGNMSPGELTASKLAAEAAASADRHGYSCVVWGKDEIEAEGMGGILAVNQGSLDPPSFSILEWHPLRAVNDHPVVLVGKGVVFDTGGLSLKPTKNGMDQMKFDMAGAAAVIGAMEAVARLKLPVHVVGLIPATDNRPGMRAYMPGEVVTMHAGTTVEVLNTDAEGRMLLADALSYARRFDPMLVVDIATLTGAQVVALGTLAAAMMTNETEGAADRLAMFAEAGMATGDRVAGLPMFDEYAMLLESDVADLKNVGGKEASSITAAKFLERFTDYPWVHLDIAGPAALETPDGYRPKGATGFGVRLLVEVVRRIADSQ